MYRKIYNRKSESWKHSRTTWYPFTRVTNTDICFVILYYGWSAFSRFTSSQPIYAIYRDKKTSGRVYNDKENINSSGDWRYPDAENGLSVSDYFVFASRHTMFIYFPSLEIGESESKIDRAWLLLQSNIIVPLVLKSLSHTFFLEISKSSLLNYILSV